MAKQLTWTDKTRDVAALLQTGKDFMEVVGMGYSKNMVSRVKTALDSGQKPVEPGAEESVDGVEQGSSTRERQFMGVKTPTKGSPISFKVGTDDILLDPLELYHSYRYYLDLSRKNGGISNSFSEVLTYGMQLVWMMCQDIPITENMMRAIFYGYK